ncbi:hypothetical protein SOVF_158910 [Spinacia oleracea]|nr:hypothetical protein SOVF_158910 [Spinacia oleracea]
MGPVYMLLVTDEEIMMEERKKAGGGTTLKERDEDIELVVPPVFNDCTRVLKAEDQIEARDLYWEAVCRYGK